jgi:F-type H+-transporting ATPase subunit alpha
MAGVQGLLDKIPVERIVEWDAKFQAHLQANEQDLLNEISQGVMTKELEPKSECPISPRV